MSNPIIHIGLHKTGTTYLQSSLFPNLKNYNVYRGYESHRQLLKLGREKKIIISDEGISGDLWGMNYLNDFKENIYFLKKTYNNPKIIFGIRNHSSFILSVYKQYLYEKGTNDLDFLYNINNTGIIKSEELLLLPKITLLRESFEKVFIYSQESLISNENDFISALTNFLDTDINSNYQSQKDSNVGVNTILQVKTLQRMNRFSKSLEKLHPSLGWYNKVCRKLKITPRDICQKRLRNFKSEKFDLDNKTKHFMDDFFKDDWLNASKNVSY